jgi:hypothetical protein
MKVHLQATVIKTGRGKVTLHTEFKKLKNETPAYVKDNIGVDIEKDMDKTVDYMKESGEYPK